MFVIAYMVQGREYVHVGTEKGIRTLLKSELAGVKWRFLSRRRFTLQVA
jgi:hypothetical protein